MSPNIKFTYFNSAALGESIRMLLKYGDIDFEDVRFEDEEWPKIKPSTPFGQVPIYEENGKVVDQSNAIARYIAKKVKLVGETDWENLEIDAIVDTITDFRGKIAEYHYERNPTVKSARKEPLFKETIPYYLKKFEEIAKQNNGHFALGKLTWADIVFVGLLKYFNYMVQTDLIKDYPNLNLLVNNVTSIPKIQAWISSRPQTTS